MKHKQTTEAQASSHAQTRKDTPVCSGVLDYFPDALFEVSRCSLAGQRQHNPGSKLHWDRSKSGDEADALLRHLAQRDELDSDGILHASKVAWRGLALLQKTLEARGEAEMSQHNVKRDDGLDDPLREALDELRESPGW
tara:strand:- start:2975 stop:3391 length:417 start_codon:yes stop_codon:yes gene_type:complete